MAAQVHPLADAMQPAAEAQPSLEQLLQQSRELLTESTDQLRDISDLAFMELELAVNTSKWLLLSVLLFCVSILLSCTFTVAALTVLLIDTVTPAAALLLCGVVNAIGASVLFFWVKSLSRKMTFRTLRQQLHGKASHDEH